MGKQTRLCLDAPARMASAAVGTAHICVIGGPHVFVLSLSKWTRHQNVTPEWPPPAIVLPPRCLFVHSASGLCLPDPEWASHTLRVFVCLSCSGVHRSMPQVSKVKSARLDAWEEAQVEALLGPGSSWPPMGTTPPETHMSPKSPPTSDARFRTVSNKGALFRSLVNSAGPWHPALGHSSGQLEDLGGRDGKDSLGQLLTTWKGTEAQGVLSTGGKPILDPWTEHTALLEGRPSVSDDHWTQAPGTPPEGAVDPGQVQVAAGFTHPEKQEPYSAGEQTMLSVRSRSQCSSDGGVHVGSPWRGQRLLALVEGPLLQDGLQGYREGFLCKGGRNNGQLSSRKFMLREQEGALKYFNRNDGSRARAAPCAKEPKASMKIEHLNATFQPAHIGHPHGLQVTYLKDNSTRNIFVCHEDGKVGARLGASQGAAGAGLVGAEWAGFPRGCGCEDGKLAVGLGVGPGACGPQTGQEATSPARANDPQPSWIVGHRQGP
ncbi:hypothetical protein MC885_000307 [Smutsia gigantea]|nr:hypothetical protein MC885_000307 [Smutsia gigantea]